MITRIQLNSKTYRVDVYKHMPSVEENKRYSCKVERLTVPAQAGGLIFNQPLFSVERRLSLDADYEDIVDGVSTYNGNRDLHIASTFTPHNVRTVSELVYQMNSFLRKLLLSLVASAEDFEHPAGADVNAVPGIFEPPDFDDAFDWYEMRDTPIGVPVQRALEAVYRCDGRIGIKFSVEAVPMFVLHLTAEGKRILGWSKDFLAVDQNNGFSVAYTDFVPAAAAGDGASSVTLALPAAPTSIIGTFDNSVFNHGHYRHELVLRTSLPMRNYVECDQKAASYKNQLASYRYPSEPIIQEYDGTLFKTLKNERRNKYLFEQSTRTHNEFLLTSSKLQNFHMRLMQRNYEWDADLDRFKITEEPYPLPHESLWTMQLAVKPLQD